MNANHLIKKIVILGIIFFLTIGFIFPSASAEPDIDGGDGVYIDNFNDDSNVTLNNCYADTKNGTIILTSTDNNIYLEFNDGKSHRAYKYQTRRFSKSFPPNLNIIFKPEYPLRKDTDEIFQLTALDRDAFNTSSTLPKKFNVHHFRFKVKDDAEDIAELFFYWNGKGQNIKNIRFYCWRYDDTVTSRGEWKPLDSTEENNDWETLTPNISSSSFIKKALKNNILDVCVVAEHDDENINFVRLFTDRVYVWYETTLGYSLNEGSVETKNAINPKGRSFSDTKDFYWEKLTWNDYKIGNASIKYHILHENRDGEWVKVKNKILKNNTDGFTESPVYLYSIPTKNDTYSKLKIEAILSTDNHKITPKIFNWAIIWQKKANKWQDTFNYTFRVEKHNINIIDSNISIAPFTDDWPMFGQNPQNTRTSVGKGPDKYNFNWWSRIGDETDSISNSVIMDGSLYVTSDNSKELYILNEISTTSPPNKKGLPKNHFNIINLTDLNKSLVNAPTLSENKIIIATGEQGTENYIIALDRDNPNTRKWIFYYPEDDPENQEQICYFSSPVVYQEKIFITSWSGDSGFVQSNNNNKIITLQLLDGSKLWEYDLPAGSYSTPAVYNNTVFVGCNNKYGNSLFALNAENGSLIWKKSVGAIGRASPVVYNGMVFVVSEVKKLIGSVTKVTVWDIKNGSFIGEKTICRNLFSLRNFLDRTKTFAESTPAIHKNVLYVASPNGFLFALDTNNIEGKEKWKKPVFTSNEKLKRNTLLISPVYAVGKIYIGTSSGYFYSFDASNGNKNEGWDTFQTHWRNDTGVDNNIRPPIVTSPIVSNGLVFFGDNNGKLYSLGNFKKPEDKEITGSVVSIPIRLPNHYWWNKFQVDHSKLVKNKKSIKFSILDKNRNFIEYIQDGNSIVDNNKFINRTIRLQAELYAKNISNNPELYYWSVSFIKDTDPPIIDKGSFEPEGGWINKTTPVCRVKVTDEGTGLLLSNNIKYTLYYFINDTIVRKYSDSPEYAGKNGDKSSILTVDISSLNFSDKITKLDNITFKIKDLANNSDSRNFEFKQDFDKPTSSIQGSISDTYKFSPIEIKAIADDPGNLNKDASGIALVELKYRFSQSGKFTGDWQHFGKTVPENPKVVYTARWEFTDIKGGGWYQLCTIATDARGNKENLPKENDTRIVTFILDPNPPNNPQITVPPWFNTTPKISAVFSDDFLLDSVEYRLYPETEWREIKSGINTQSYKTTWTLSSIDWDQISEGETHYLYFRITDSLGNINKIENPDQAFKIKKDESKPLVDLDIPDLETEGFWDDKFNISVYTNDSSGSGIESVELYYRYSKDNTTWRNWTRYEDKLTTAPFDWKFHADEGNGYYEFYSTVEDVAGNTETSPIIRVIVNIFPLVFVVSMVILVIALIFFTIVIYVLWRKKKK